MKKIILLATMMSLGLIAVSQDTLYNTPKNGWIYINPKSAPEIRTGLALAQTLAIPTGNGAPNRIWHGDVKQASIYFDSTGGLFYIRNPRDNTWSQVSGSGGGGSKFGIDDNLGLQDRIMDMQVHDFTLNNLGNYNAVIGSLSGQYTQMNMQDQFIGNYMQNSDGSQSVYSRITTNAGFIFNHSINEDGDGVGIGANGNYTGVDTYGTGRVRLDAPLGEVDLYGGAVKLRANRNGGVFDLSVPILTDANKYIVSSVNGVSADSTGNVNASGKFGIDDTLGIQDRLINMETHNFTFDNFTNLSLNNSAHEPLVVFGNGAINQGAIGVFDNTANSSSNLTPTYLEIGKAGGFRGRISAGNLSDFHYNNLPNSDGTLTVSATINGNTFTSDANGNINMGGVSGAAQSWEQTLGVQGTNPFTDNYSVNMGSHNFNISNLSSLNFSTANAELAVSDEESVFSTGNGNGSASTGNVVEGGSNIPFAGMAAQNLTSLKDKYLRVYGDSITMGNQNSNPGGMVLKVHQLDSSDANLNNIAWFDANDVLHRGHITGGTGGISRLQEAFNNSVTNLDNPIISVTGNTFSLNGDGTQATLQAKTTTATNNDQKTVATISRLSAGLPALGLAGSIDFIMSGNSSGSNTSLQAGRIGYALEDVNMSTYKSKFQVYTTYNNSNRLSMELSSAGQLKLPNYNSGVFTGTAVYALGVASDGTVVQIPADSTATGPTTVEIDTTFVANHTTQVTIPHGQSGTLNQVPSVQVDNPAAEDFSITSDATNIVLRYPVGFSGSVSYHVVINLQ